MPKITLVLGFTSENLQNLDYDHIWNREIVWRQQVVNELMRCACEGCLGSTDERGLALIPFSANKMWLIYKGFHNRKKKKLWDQNYMVLSKFKVLCSLYSTESYRSYKTGHSSRPYPLWNDSRIESSHRIVQKFSPNSPLFITQSSSAFSLYSFFNTTSNLFFISLLHKVPKQGSFHSVE